MTQARTALERAILRLLVPLARLLLKRGMAYGEASELLRRAYVAAAQRHEGVPGRKQTASRIAVLTGLTRKEVSRLLGRTEAPPASEARRLGVNRAARVLSAWVREEPTTDAAGDPLPLPFEAEQGPSFAELVRRHSGDMPARAVLDELLRVGAVRALDDGRFLPMERGYVPKTDPVEKLAILGSDVADLIATIDHNLDDDVETPFFQRKVAYDRLPASFMPALRERVRREAQKLLEQLDREMSAADLDDRAQSAETRKTRAMVGIYYHEQDADDALQEGRDDD